MKKNGTITVRNISIIFFDDEKFIYVADKEELDYQYLNVIYENYCPTCPEDEEIEKIPIGMCKVIERKKLSVRELKELLKDNLDMFQTVYIDMRLKYGDYPKDDDEFFIYKLKNQLI